MNDLSALADAKRFSNNMCASQLRALQHGIGTVESEIKEDMVSDLKQFEKEEAQQKRAFEQQQHQVRMPPRAPLRAIHTAASGSESGYSGGNETPHHALLAAIRQRNNGAPQQEDARQRSKRAIMVEDVPSSDEAAKTSQAADAPPAARSALLAAIRQRGPETDYHDTTTGTSATDTVSSSNGSVTETGVQRSALLAAIRRRQPSEDGSTQSQESPHRPGSQSSPQDGRAAMLAAITQRGSGSIATPPSGLLAAIQTHKKGSEEHTSHAASEPGSRPPAQYVPREYKMRSKFTAVMREALLRMKTTAEDVEMEMETLQSVWEATARYLGEDPEGSSSEYVLSLLNRFLLDVKVAKSLLFRKGMRFAGDLAGSHLLPDARTCISLRSSSIVFGMLMGLPLWGSQRSEARC